MAKTTPRIFVDAALGQGAEVELSQPQMHYLINVLRMAAGDAVQAFNSANGEWACVLADVKKKSAKLQCNALSFAPKPPPDIDFVFAPLKHARLDYVVQKAVELGARKLRPVITHRTIAERVNLDRMRANVIEAAEQCNLVYVPEVEEPLSLDRTIATWPEGRSLVFCDEAAEVKNPLEALQNLKLPTAILVGPEGGFTTDERAMLRSLPVTTAISLGPRIMRADTAALAALSMVQAVQGDWRE
jgi:16S rRNA (uracil1498-N3)-methyltransferase